MGADQPSHRPEDPGAARAEALDELQHRAGRILGTATSATNTPRATTVEARVASNIALFARALQRAGPDRILPGIRRQHRDEPSRTQAAVSGHAPACGRNQSGRGRGPRASHRRSERISRLCSRIPRRGSRRSRVHEGRPDPHPAGSASAVYDKLYRASRRWLLVAEYYNPTPVAIRYRGHENRLFKRDFAGDLLDAHADLRLIDYGFVYRRDPAFSQDDLTWFLLEKHEGAAQ